MTLKHYAALAYVLSLSYLAYLGFTQNDGDLIFIVKASFLIGCAGLYVYLPLFLERAPDWWRRLLGERFSNDVLKLIGHYEGYLPPVGPPTLVERLVFLAGASVVLLITFS